MAPILIFNDKGQIVEKQEGTVLAKLNITSQKLYERLATVKIGETVTWAELKGIAGEDVKPGLSPKGYRLLKKARDLLKSTMGYFFDPVWSVGIQRISPEEVALTSDRYIKRIHRTSKTGALTIKNCVRDMSDISEEARQKGALTLSVLGALSLFTQKQNLQQIEHKITQQLPSKDVLQLFSDL